jgi:predicted RNA-binding protein YlxR (DUF448 family)
VDYPNRRVDKETGYNMAPVRYAASPESDKKGRAALIHQGRHQCEKKKKKVLVKKDKMVDIKVPPQRGLCLLSSKHRGPKKRRRMDGGEAHA